MAKAELFDINKKEEDRIKAEMAMKPIERLYLCLDLMDTAIALSKHRQPIPDPDDKIDWIVLPMKKNAKRST